MNRRAEAATPSGGRLRIADRCTGCGACVSACPVHALTLASTGPGGSGRKLAAVDRRRCTLCGVCLPTCPRQALAIESTSP